MANYALNAQYYQQFDADFAREIPGEGYGGWQTAQIEIAREHTAVVLMHAWDTGTRAAYPGWHRAVEYASRAQQIGAEVLPCLLSAVRAATTTRNILGIGGRWNWPDRSRSRLNGLGRTRS
jgi:hypothetical protein